MTFIYANFTTIMFALNFGEKKKPMSEVQGNLRRKKKQIVYSNVI